MDLFESIDRSSDSLAFKDLKLKDSWYRVSQVVGCVFVRGFWNKSKSQKKVFVAETRKCFTCTRITSAPRGVKVGGESGWWKWVVNKQKITARGGKTEERWTDEQESHVTWRAPTFPHFLSLALTSPSPFLRIFPEISPKSPQSMQWKTSFTHLLVAVTMWVPFSFAPYKHFWYVYT